MRLRRPRPSPGLPPVPPGAARPRKDLTPGEMGPPHAVRNIPPGVKALVYANYGIGRLRRILYVIDHLIPLELDGTNGGRNLWPQPRGQAKIKDAWENYYATAVATWHVNLAQAVADILAAWGPA